MGSSCEVWWCVFDYDSRGLWVVVCECGLSSNGGGGVRVLVVRVVAVVEWWLCVCVKE